MEVVEVDPIRPQALQRAGDRAANDVGELPSVDRSPRPNFVASTTSLATPHEDLPEQPLAPAAVAIRLGRVEEAHARVERRLDDRTRLLGPDPPAEVVAPETDPRDAQAALAELDRLHETRR